jgi:hypothetical protein
MTNPELIELESFSAKLDADAMERAKAPTKRFGGNYFRDDDAREKSRMAELIRKSVRELREIQNTKSTEVWCDMPVKNP